MAEAADVCLQCVISFRVLEGAEAGVRRPCKLAGGRVDSLRR